MNLLNRVRVCRRSFKLGSGLSEGEGFRESGLGQRRKQETVTVDERCHGAETILGIKRQRLEWRRSSTMLMSPGMVGETGLDAGS